MEIFYAIAFSVFYGIIVTIRPMNRLLTATRTDRFIAFEY